MRILTFFTQTGCRTSSFNLHNQFDIKSVNAAHGVKKKAEWFYQGKVKGSPSQYSDAFKDWMLARYAQDSSFFQKARTSASGKSKK